MFGKQTKWNPKFRKKATQPTNTCSKTMQTANVRTIGEICLKLTIKTPERR